MRANIECNTLMKSKKLLQDGQVIAFPTETIYGLGCDAKNCEAVKKIYRLKKRSYSKPLAVFFKNVKQAKKYLIFNKNANILARNFMPGEITLVLKKKKNSGLSKFLNINSDTLGFRIPNHKFCLQLLEEFGEPICVTSANISGQEISTRSEDVKKYFGDSVYIVRRDNAKSSKKASTIIELTKEKVEFIREGSISFDKVRKILKGKNKG